jgi:hypothetical protein
VPSGNRGSQRLDLGSKLIIAQFVDRSWPHMLPGPAGGGWSNGYQLSPPFFGAGSARTSDISIAAMRSGSAARSGISGMLCRAWQPRRE